MQSRRKVISVQIKTVVLLAAKSFPPLWTLFAGGRGFFFSWHCIQISGMCLLVLANSILVGGILYRRSVLLKSWIVVHLIVIIGQLHVFIVYVLRKMYTECLLTLASSLWTAMFIVVVYKCVQLMEQHKSNDVPLLSNENLWILWI